MTTQPNTASSQATVMLEHAANQLRERLAKKHFYARGKYGQPLPVLRRDLPYVACPTVDGRYLLLNRDYKLLGTEEPGGNPIILLLKHGKDSSKTIHLPKDELKAITISNAYGSAFFDDGSTPWRSRKDADNYLQKLELLLQYADND